MTTPTSSRGGRRRRGHPRTLVALAGLLGAAAALGWLIGPESRVVAPQGMVLGLATGCVPMGLFIIRARPRHRVGRLLVAVGFAALVALAAGAWAAWLPAAWATQWTWWPPVVGIPVILAAFPDEQPRPGERGWLVPSLILAGAGATVGLAGAATFAPRTLLTDAHTAPDAARPWLVFAAALAAVVVVLTIFIVAGMVRRARNATDERRSQIACLLPSGVLLLLGIGADALGVPFAMVPGVVALPVGMAVAILRYQVSDLDLAVNRPLVWMVMSVAIAATFALSVSLVSGTVLGGSPMIATAIGTGVVAAGFDPLRRRVQRLVDRLLFGERGNPQGVLNALGQRMQLASNAGGMLTQLVETLTGALQVPHVRMLVDGPDGQPVLVAEHGRPQAELVAFPMVAHREVVGSLEVAPRRSGEHFTPAETRLLGEVASQAAIAARAHRLTLELLRARETLVRAREEERLRLRRDLHDGLGPALAGTRMQLSVARSQLAGHAAAATLDTALQVLTDCTYEVRRLVDGLRPAALDQGLEAAVRQRAAALFAEHEHQVIVIGVLSELPAAVEVAAYRIITEAMTNVVKHAAASRCRIEISRDEREVRIVVQDNGAGGQLAREGGVGVESMTARAIELGGSVTVTPTKPGTRVAARLPLMSP